MRIIYGEEKAVIEDHARKTVKALEGYELRNPNMIRPRGVAFHSSVYPNTCDDCGETFWSKDQWGSHIGCKGVRKGLGFSVE